MIFGAGAFGSPVTGQGFFPCIGSCGPSNPASFVDTDLPGASYFRGVGIPTSSVFVDDGFNNTRFFVLGEDVDIDIDIKPGGDPNSINCNNDNGVITVAIRTTDDFDATTVDHSTIAFEGATEIHRDPRSDGPRRHEEDVDGDGDIDLVFHFRLGDTDLTCDSTEGTLTGETFDGQSVEGNDSVNMIGS